MATNATATVLSLYHQQVALHPHALAVITESGVCTYEELDRKSNKWAQYIVQLCLSKNAAVAVYMHRGESFVVAMLAIMKAGATYLPIDANTPKERVLNILQDAGVELVITDIKDFDANIPVLRVNSIPNVGKAFQSKKIDPQSNAYIIYTSGSTGSPKGTVVTHDSLYASTIARLNYYGNANCLLLMPSFAFDASLATIWWSLSSGASLIVASDETLKDAKKLNSLLLQNPVDAYVCVPSYYRFLLEVNIIPATSSHRAILGGEALDESLMGLHYANFPLSELYQEYGPTECTIWATVAKVEKDKPLSIGFPVGDVKTKIVEDELWLGGRQVAAKYLNRPIETAASFVDAENERWYRTGDIVSVSEDGELVFIGRKDEQVKVNGHRVELNEIVCCLQNVRGVKNAVVAVREAGGKQVIAFLQLEENEIFEEGSIRNYLQSKLPAYMVPGAFIEVSSFPQTSNGKVDKRALLEIYESHLQVSTEEGDSVLTSIILSYWRAQLARPDLGLHDSLLSFGANSLSILRFVHWLQLQHLHAISFADAFKAETVQNISLAAKDIYAAENENYVPEENLPISFTQEALWVVDQLEGSIHYHINFSYSTNHILHVPYFNEALRLLVAKYPSLATRFIMYDESVFLASSEVPILERIVDANAFFTKAIELTKGPLFRAGFETFEGTTKLYLSVHHMVADGWSLQFIISNLLNFYDQLRQEEKVMIEVDNSAISFALYQRESLKNGDWNPSLKYWSHQLKDCARLEIPADFAPATQPTRKGAAVKFVIGNERWEKLQNLCEQERVTPYMVLLTTLKILLYKYTNCAQDVCVGSVLSNRPNPNWQSSVGYFANTVAIRSQVLGTECVHQLLQQVKENTLSAILHGEVPFEKVVDTLQVERSLESHPFFDVMMVLQDQQLPQTIQTTTSIWKHEEVIRTTSKFRLLWDFHLDTDHIIGWLEFNEQYLPSTAQNMTDHFLQVLDAVIETPLASISSISILPKKEIEKLLSMPVVNWDRHTNLVKLFQEVALKFPSKTALRFEGESMDYYTLHLASNKLAHHLLKSGVQPKSLVPLCLPRSFEMVISILAVLKIGACYVPIDPEYPQDRIDFMLEDTASLFILTREDVVLQTNIQKIFVESIHYAYSDESELNVDIHPNDLAYIIYTSGSTGRPKGVMIEHQQVVRLLFNEQPLFDFNENDIWTLFHSYCFDFSVWEMYGAILYGGCLVIVPSAARNTFDFAKILQEENVTVLNQTPTAFYALQEEVCKTYPSLNVRYVIYGGEALNTAYLRNWYTHYPACKLVNMYGITETTVHVTFKEIGDDVIAAGISNIGIPIPTLGCLVMDADMQLLPTGVPGELYVKGDGLARGYYNNPHLTAERFIDNPFSPGEKLYRSGDLVRWTNAGEMEYLGRIDQQVKIRGYRIELGEIETTILQSGYVSQCVVIAYEGKLVAYVVSDNKDNILQYLQHRLPSYMVPSLLVNVPSIPITSNGKVDRKALPKPVDLLVTGSDEPRNETEQQLCTIWQDLLGISKVGIHDNFFEVGGDSIVSIQVVSRARKLGLDIKPRDIFQFQTIAQLSSSLTQLEDIVAPVLPLEGESPMLPIQQWFFEQGHENLHHYNQAVLLDISKEVTASQLQAAVDHLCKEHDALRFRYLLGEDGSWKQYYNGAGITVETISVETTNIATICTQVQQGLNIENGPIARVVLLELPGVKNGLFIAAHHLCTDGVSWRILCEDLESYITCIVDDKPLPVLNRTTSYRAWAERLIGLKDHPVLLKEASYWEKIVSRVQPLPVDHALQTPRLIGDMRRLQVSLPAHLTQSLLQNVHQAYSTRIDDILLSALQLTLQGYTGLNEHVVTLESHGREGFGADNSRVIGWFTSMYPVLLSSTGDLSNVIISTKESLRGIPYEGLGYGISKYFNKNIGLVYTPCILFNYLGRLSNLVVGRSYLTQSTDILQGTGEASAATNVYPAQLGVDGYIFEESLQFTWSYNTLEFAAGTIEKLANGYLFHLTNIIRHCINAEVITPTIWDTGLGGKLSSEEFELLRALESFEEVHPLTSVQAGMLYHGLMDNHAGTYVEQFTAEVNGVDEKLLSASWHVVLQQFGILRTSFHYEHLAHGVQVVHGHVSLPFSKYLIQEDEVESFLTGDRLAGFDFRQAPLMRVTLLEVSNGRTLMVWTFHHILLDGWSVPIVIKALQTHYESLLRGEPVSFEVDNFSTFTKYLQKRDVISEVTHWSQYLRGFETPSLLPFVPANVARNQGSATTGSIQLALNEGEHAALQSFAQRNRVTLNTLVQGTWSYLLSRYSGREDVLFGVTVSGRPTDIAHSEERVGLYIHTILQRTQVNSGNINSWLATIQDEHTRNRDYSYAPLSTLQELAGVKGDLFDSLLVFENFPVEDTSNVAGSLRFSHIQLAEHTNYLLTILVELNPTLQINFSYNAGLLGEETVSMVAGHFKNTLQQLVTLQRIEEIELLTPAENAQQQSFQGERAAYPVGSTMVDLLREAAILHANKPALTFSGKHMSYAELEERSNQLANYLQAQGVSRGSIVPLCLERSFEMVIGLLGIIKSGGAYVPIDPSYPAERIAYMCNGGTVGFVLTTSDTQLSTPLVKIEIDNCRYEAYSKDIFDPGITPRDPLYVIYTSGSTGQPKGVVNAHEGLVNRLSWAAHYHALQSSDVILQKTTYCFDVSAWELMLPLMVGARMVLAKPGGQKDSQYLRQLIEEEGVTVLHFVPGMLGAFLSDIEAGACESLQHVVCSGEALLASHVSMYQEKLCHAKLHNFYGPTEAAIDVTYWEVPLCQAVEKVLIGRPVQNVDVYILDKNLHRLPVGVPGELYIGGVQVALGYLNNPALTAERFITNPFGEGTLYKTGDLASWAASGEIEYHGRIDDQVKIRGYRIELGEIETTLQQSGLVQQNVVIAYEGKLVAYVVAEDFNKDNILQYLQQRLPSYMVPSLMVNVPSIPVTSNGKVDRKALPKPVDLLVTGSDEPRNETEQQLCTIWQDLLGISKVGIHDNFFEVGGDSIVSIQVVSRARKLGLDIKPRDIFQFQTIAQLSSSLTQLEDIVAPVLPLEGESPMLPIQQWFFEQGHENLHHYNQAVLLDISKEVSASQLQAAVDYLCKEHDALRFRYSLGEDGSWKQYYNGAGITVETISVETTNIATICTQVQQGLNIENGPIARVVLLELPGVKNGLFIAGHHLCTDGVSWRILCEDLESYITCIVDDKPLPVLNRTTSYRAWAERLIGLKDHPVLLKEASYWEKIVSRVQPFPVDHALQTPRLIRDMRRLQVSLPAHLTQSLLQNVHQAYSTRIDDILLSALQLTLQGYTGLNEHVVTLESHGREGFGADNSRVIGWFTSMYPVLLSSTGDLSNVIISTKESLRGIPYEGLGYGISKYFNKNIGLVYTPCILFNYLGRLSNLVVGRSYLTQSTDILQGTGEASAATNVYPAQLGVDGYIFEESLQFTWSYNTLEFAAGTVEKLANDYLFHLTNIIRHCINAEVITPTIWDTGLGGKLSSEEFGLLRALESFEEVHPLTSVQAGMLYHGLMDNHAGTYVEQFTAEVNGVDEKLLSASWHVVLQQFGILRTSFHYEHLAHGVQVVHGHVSLPFSKYLIQEDEVESFLTGDRLAGFDFSQAPLMRVTLLEVSNGRTLMVWTFHHILLDGWSVPIVIKALQTHYESLLRGEPVSFEVDNFSTFTKYLQKRDVISEVTHWSQYLRGFETPSLLPFVPANVARNQGSANTGSIQLALNEGEHAALQSFAQRNRVTLNTLVQGTWSYLLSRYSGREDVLFGVTVSGRPTDIAHSEERVGLYIHTILQRTQVNSGNINSWLATIQDEHTRNRDYSYAPLSTLQELAGVKGDLFDSLLVFENFPVEDTSNVAGSLRFSHIQLAEHTNYLLTILVELNPTLQINFSYNAGLLNEETVSMVAGHFKNTLQQLMTLQRIEEIELLTPAENAQQQSFQGERAAYPVGSTMVDLLREAAILHANKPALTFSGKHMSYAELEERSNQLANYLQAQGVSRGSIVPLCLERSFEMVIGLLGIIKSGGAYVPIDPSYPAERIAYMCNGGTVGFVLTTSDTQLSTPLVKIEIDNCRYEAYSKDIFDPGITPRDPLYVIYTSGSTGQPKGVVNAHEGLVNRLSWAAHYHALQSSDVILQKTTYCFDVSAWELMLPLMVGARMVLAKPGGQKDSQYLRQLIEEEGVTVLHFVPGMLGAFLSDIEAGACESLQHVVCSGEALLASHVSMYQEKLGHAKLHNFYGPTEAAIDVTYWEVPLCQAVEKVLIGRPVQNVDVYILDKNLHRLPVGVPGELYIGGVQVALGYLNNPALTAERFITNPFGEGTLYKTGDLASWTASGEIEYHGRIDDQVKIRGYRIELGEIETTLQQSGLVQQNVVIANEGKLVAYVVSDNFDKDNILQYLQQRLPSYMVPSLMVNVLSIPITSNGKIDRKALPKPGNLLVTGSDEPRNETEQQLCTIWQDLLGISKVGIHDNFFEVGGDSIKLIQLYRQVNQTFGKRLNVSDLFQYNSIHLQAGAVQEEQSADTQIMV